METNFHTFGRMDTCLGKPSLEKTHVSVRRAYCIQADDLNVLLLAINYEDALLLAADQSPLLWCFARLLNIHSARAYSTVI